MKKVFIAIVLISIGFVVGVATRPANKTNAVALPEPTKETKLSIEKQTKRVISPEARPINHEDRHFDGSQIFARLLEPQATPALRLKIAIHCFESLVDAGPESVASIADFLNRNQDIDYTGAGFPKMSRTSAEFVLPPSLRFGLFDVLRRIGGPDAAAVLAETLRTTGRGAEVAYLTRALEEMAPGQYQNLAVSVARELAQHPSNSTNGIDKYDRDYAYGVLNMYGDNSLVNDAKALLVRSDGQLDRSALQYLQKALGEKAIDLAYEAYNDARLDPAKKEPLARVALFYAGANDSATQLYEYAINDPSLSIDARRNLIEDLNQDGFADRKNLTPDDGKLIDARLKFVQDRIGSVTEPRLQKAYAEALKDLQNMRASLVH